MKSLLQRVTHASVGLLGGGPKGLPRGGRHETISQIGPGFLVLLGVAQNDTDSDIDYLVNKTINLRVFADQNGKFNLSVKDINGSLLIVSQFTLFADTKKGNRPGFTQAAPPPLAENLYNKFVEKCKATGLNIQTGLFASHMQITLVNDGPVTILIESRTRQNCCC